jgi:hypothetical protein
VKFDLLAQFHLAPFFRLRKRFAVRPAVFEDDLAGVHSFKNASASSSAEIM